MTPSHALFTYYYLKIYCQQNCQQNFYKVLKNKGGSHALQARGHPFESDIAHHKKPSIIIEGFLFSLNNNSITEIKVSAVAL